MHHGEMADGSRGEEDEEVDAYAGGNNTYLHNEQQQDIHHLTEEDESTAQHMKTIQAALLPVLERVWFKLVSPSDAIYLPLYIRLLLSLEVPIHQVQSSFSPSRARREEEDRSRGDATGVARAGTGSTAPPMSITPPVRWLRQWLGTEATSKLMCSTQSAVAAAAATGTVGNSPTTPPTRMKEKHRDTARATAALVAWLHLADVIAGPQLLRDVVEPICQLTPVPGPSSSHFSSSSSPGIINACSELICEDIKTSVSMQKVRSDFPVEVILCLLRVLQYHRELNLRIAVYGATSASTTAVILRRHDCEGEEEEEEEVPCADGEETGGNRCLESSNCQSEKSSKRNSNSNSKKKKNLRQARGSNQVEGTAVEASAVTERKTQEENGAAREAVQRQKLTLLSHARDLSCCCLNSLSAAQQDSTGSASPAMETAEPQASARSTPLLLFIQPGPSPFMRTAEQEVQDGTSEYANSEDYVAAGSEEEKKHHVCPENQVGVVSSSSSQETHREKGKIEEEQSSARSLPSGNGRRTRQGRRRPCRQAAQEGCCDATSEDAQIINAVCLQKYLCRGFPAHLLYGDAKGSFCSSVAAAATEARTRVLSDASAAALSDVVMCALVSALVCLRAHAVAAGVSLGSSCSTDSMQLAGDEEKQIALRPWTWSYRVSVLVDVALERWSRLTASR